MSQFEENLADVVAVFTNDSANVDRANSIPLTHFDQLASLGLHRAFAPNEVGGLGLILPDDTQLVAPALRSAPVGPMIKV
jgi:hypothetical protein